MSQDAIRARYKQMVPGWQETVGVYKNTLSPLIGSETVVLEAGCGFSNLYAEDYKRAKKVIGVDISQEYLNANNVIQEKIVADLSSFPQVPDASVDLILSAWVFEHLKSPDMVFREFARVLKPGGRVVFVTPNSWNYIVMLNRLIPHWLRMKIVLRLAGSLTVDPMPTFYRANNPLQLRSLAKQASLRVENLIFNGDPSFVAINSFFFWVGRMIERLLSLPLLTNFRVNIIGVLVK